MKNQTIQLISYKVLRCVVSDPPKFQCSCGCNIIFLQLLQERLVAEEAEKLAKEKEEEEARAKVKFCS